MEISRLFKKDKITLHFSIENCLEDSTYLLEFIIMHSEDPDEKFETEEKNNKDKNGTINFSKEFPYEYDFSKIQRFKLNLKRWVRTKYGKKFVKLSIKEKFYLYLSTIVSSKNSVFKTKTIENKDNCETIVISAENPDYNIYQKNLKKYTFFDYLKAGIKFNSFIIIDFTEKNLHTYDLENNQFLQVIVGFRETLVEYVKSFKVYGYGASLKDDFDNNKKYFNLSMQEDPELVGFTRIKEKYFDCLDKINYEKKGYLSKVFDNIKKEILEKYSPDIYNIIFLLIHNKPSKDDIQNSIDFMIEKTNLPLSIVVILIGDKSDDEIKEIRTIFSNKHKMSSNSIERTRNNISFFTMKSCNFNNEILKNKCLREIPEQALNYYQNNLTSPKDIREQNLDKLRESYKVFDPKLSLYEDEGSAPSIEDIKIKIGDHKTQVISKKVNKLVDNAIKENKEQNLNKKGLVNTPGYSDTNDINNNINNINIINNQFEKNQMINEININSDSKNNIKKPLKNPFSKNQYVNTPNPDKQNNENINKNIKNPFCQKQYINTPNPDKQNNENINKKIQNPFSQKQKDKIKEDEKEDKKEEENMFSLNKINLQSININNIDTDNIKLKSIYIDNNNNYNINEIFSGKKDYINKKNNNNFDDNINIINNNENNIINNNYINKFDEDKNNNNLNINIINNKNNLIHNDINKSEEEKTYKNSTPNPNEIHKNKIISNPFQNKANDDEKKYKNGTPGNEIKKRPDYLQNPFLNKNNEKRDIKEDIKDEKTEPKIGSHFKRYSKKDFSKLSTNSSNRLDNYEIDNW